MTKDFFEYVKELVPEKGSVFFTVENHTSSNSISLYDIVNLLSGQKIKRVDEITAYSWNVERLWDYPFPIMGVMFLYHDGREKWVHFSRHAFIGAICIMATKNDIEFEQINFEEVRQAWARKINNEEPLEGDKIYTDCSGKESNFNNSLFATKETEDLRYRDYKPTFEWECLDSEFGRDNY